MQLQSQAFENGGAIPNKYSANADNLSPPLAWSDVPAKTKSFALVCEDPDAPGGTFVHWAIYNIPPDWRSLPENASRLRLAHNVHQGINDAGDVGYFGPKPPGSEKHHYRFRLFALNDKTNFDDGLSEQELLEQIGSKVIDECEVTGLYGRGH